MAASRGCKRLSCCLTSTRPRKRGRSPTKGCWNIRRSSQKVPENLSLTGPNPLWSDSALGEGHHLLEILRLMSQIRATCLVCELPSCDGVANWLVLREGDFRNVEADRSYQLDGFPHSLPIEARYRRPLAKDLRPNIFFTSRLEPTCWCDR